MLCHAVPYDMIWHGVHCGFILIINSENIGSTLRRSNFLSFILAKLLFVYTIIAILIKEFFSLYQYCYLAAFVSCRCRESCESRALESSRICPKNPALSLSFVFRVFNVTSVELEKS